MNAISASATSETTPTSRSISTEATASGASSVRRPSSTARTASPPIAAGRNWPANSDTKYVRVSQPIGMWIRFARSRICQRQAIIGTVTRLTAIAASTHQPSASVSVSQMLAGSLTQSSTTSRISDSRPSSPTRVRRLIW